MTAPHTGLRLLYIAPTDDAELAHNRLRRRALERLGASLLHVDPAHAGWLERLVRRDLADRLEAAIAQHQPDVVMVADEDTLPADVADQLRAARPAKWVQLLGESVDSIERTAHAAMSYDFVFVGSTAAVQGLDRHGVKHAHYLPVGCDPSVHKPLRARGPFRANVVFAGQATPRRERYLTELVEFGLALWGPGWRKTGLRDYCRGELPSTEDFVRAYAGATVAVNVHRDDPDSANGDGAGVNRRAFEIAAIGAPQVIDARADLPALFEDGTEVLVYETPDQLKGQVKRAIQEDKYRDRLAGAARQRAISHHTYMHRLRQLLAVVTGV